jgi:hypothetical protein
VGVIPTAVRKLKQKRSPERKKMKLGKHQHNDDGKFRRERGDSHVRNLREEYPEFKDVDPRTKLKTLRERFGVDSLNKVREALRRHK